MFVVTTIDDAGIKNENIQNNYFNGTFRYTSASTTTPSSGGSGGGAYTVQPNQDEFSRGWAEVKGLTNLTLDRALIPIHYIIFEVDNKARNFNLKIQSILEFPENIPNLKYPVYSPLKIVATSFDEFNISGATIDFKVEKAWLENRNLQEKDISLYRYAQE